MLEPPVVPVGLKDCAAAPLRSVSRNEQKTSTFIDTRTELTTCIARMLSLFGGAVIEAVLCKKCCSAVYAVQMPRLVDTRFEGSRLGDLSHDGHN